MLYQFLKFYQMFIQKNIRTLYSIHTAKGWFLRHSAKKLSFPLRISSVNVSKSPGNCRCTVFVQWGTTDVAPTHIRLLIFSANSKRLLKSFG